VLHFHTGSKHSRHNLGDPKRKKKPCEVTTNFVPVSDLKHTTRWVRILLISHCLIRQALELHLLAQICRKRRQMFRKGNKKKYI